MKQICVVCGEEYTKGIMKDNDFYCVHCAWEMLEDEFNVRRVG